MADAPSRSGPQKGDFLWIKQRLDPKASYVIFEHHLTGRGETIFSASHGACGFLDRRGFTWQQVVDLDLSMEYLVIRVPPGEEERVLGRILGCGFPENIVFYIFKAEEV